MVTVDFQQILTAARQLPKPSQANWSKAETPLCQSGHTLPPHSRAESSHTTTCMEAIIGLTPIAVPPQYFCV